MKKAYNDTFVLHDKSRSEPYYKRLKKVDEMQYEHEVRIRCTINQRLISHMQISRLSSTDARMELDKTWTKVLRFQPLWKIRNYFGEKIAFYFAWQGTFVTVLWVPTIIGLVIFIYGASRRCAAL